MSKLSDPLESALRQIEQRSHAVSAKLITGEPQALADAASALQQIAVEFFQVAPSLTMSATASAMLRARLQRIAAGMAMQRENLIRRQVVVQRALGAILPAAQGSAYAKAGGAYGSIGKQTGAFKVLTA